MKYKCIVVILMFTSLFCLELCACTNTKTNEIDEGTTELLKEIVWVDGENIEHQAKFLTNGKTANSVIEEDRNITLNHIIIDDISIYEMYSESANTGKMVFFFHGQGSQKEEYLFEMINYAESGYLCVTVDLEGHGERIKDDTVMSVQVTVDTAKGINTLLDYYDTVSYANTECFSLVGLSQGGSVSYWYAAYGDRTPSALIVGSSTPDNKYQNDDTAVCNGKLVDAIWSETEIITYNENNNPINKVEKLITIPIMSGNGLNDEVISYKGTESLEKIVIKSGNANSKFYYFENVGHEVTDDFMSRIISFLNNNM